MNVRVGAATDVGRVRERNEDAYLASEPLYAVADGMGGHRGGAVASKVALEVVSEMDGAAMTDDSASERLADMLVKANRAVLERASSEPGLSGMGTTLTAVVVQPGRLQLAHVGDSRAYLVREGDLRQLTEDHSLVQRMVREGKLTPEEAEIHPHRSVLTRALGVETELEVDTQTVDVEPGDRVLLCSDGLTTMVGEEDILRMMLAGDDPDAIARSLVEAANAGGGVDNVTCVVLFVVQDGQGGGAAATAEKPYVSTAAPPAPEAPSPRRRRPLRTLAWALAVLAVLVVGLLGARAFVFSQWYVGVQDGRVALFRGMPVSVLGYELHEMVETTELSATRAMRLRTWSGLDEGITADSEIEARGIIETIRRDLERTEREREPAGQGGGG